MNKYEISVCLAFILLIVVVCWANYATCDEWGPERPYIESCGTNCVHTVYKRECVRRTW